MEARKMHDHQNFGELRAPHSFTHSPLLLSQIQPHVCKNNQGQTRERVVRSARHNTTVRRLLADAYLELGRLTEDHTTNQQAYHVPRRRQRMKEESKYKRKHTILQSLRYDLQQTKSIIHHPSFFITQGSIPQQR